MPRDHTPGRSPAQNTDPELAELTRGGDKQAFGELWKRHHKAGYALARGWPALDHDDLVAEAFTRILAALQRGTGPTTGFRPYLLVTIKHLANESARTSFAYDSDASVDMDALMHRDGSSEEQAMRVLEVGLFATAFKRLPTIFQDVLWYSMREELKPSQFARYVGASPNYASQLLSRARAKMREEYIAIHLTAPGDPECAATVRDYPAYLRRSLSPTKRYAVESHIDTCMKCMLVFEEAETVERGMRLVILPLIVGPGAAAGYLAWTQTNASSAAEADELPAPRRAVRPGAGAKGLLVTASVVAAVMVGSGIAYAATRQPNPPVSAPDAAGDRSRGMPGAGPSPLTTPAPTPTAETSTPAPTGATPAPEPQPTTAPLPTPVSRVATSVTQLAVTTPTGPNATPPEPTPAPAPTPTSDDSAPTPTPTPTDPGESIQPAEPALLAPVFTVDQDAAEVEYPLLAGTDAQPGAQIDVLDSDLSVLGSTTANAAGAWEVKDFPTMQAGTQTLAVRQSVAENASEPSDPVTITIAAPPMVAAPLAGSTVDAAGFTLTVNGVPGQNVQRLVNGEARPDAMMIGVDGTWTGVFTSATPTVNLGIRYFDTSTGRFGPTATIAFTASGAGK